MTIRSSFFERFKNQQYIEQLKKIPHKFSAIHNEESSTTEITVYGVIGDSWWEDSVSASDIDNALKQAGNNDILINLNSPGGDAFDGISIYNRLKRHTGKVKVHVDGWACSAASIIAMAADELIMGTGSMIMIHEGSTIAWGKKGDFLKTADMLSKLDDSIVDIYMTKATKERDEIVSLVENETWFTANEAIDIGFANQVQESTTSATAASTMKIDQQQIQEIIKAVTNNLKQNNNQTNEPAPPAPVQTKRKGFIF
ncbi:head maturation protease, ClpP-related [Peribacillus sp. SCS-26]|uniref:head maturation protease, ClpP-related n=1 Tax=Paraperibacillus marinus TaxID=3115295 RepID=UPI003905FC6D